MNELDGLLQVYERLLNFPMLQNLQTFLNRSQTVLVGVDISLDYHSLNLFRSFFHHFVEKAATTKCDVCRNFDLSVELFFSKLSLSQSSSKKVDTTTIITVLLFIGEVK